MSRGQIRDMDIVSDTGAIRCVVIAAKNVEAFAPSNRNLGNERNEIVRNALGIFADQAALMGADRIEVTKNPDGPALVARKHVAQHVLYDQFGPSIRVDRLEGCSSV